MKDDNMFPLKVILKHLIYITILNCKQIPVNSSILCVLIHNYFKTNFCKKSSKQIAANFLQFVRKF